MFDFLKKKASSGETLRLSIVGMHCSSCAMNIDGVLEDVNGVLESTTSYARSSTVIVFEPKTVTKEEILAALSSLEYTFQEVSEN